MKKTKLFTRLIALTLVLLSIVCTTTVGAVSTSAASINSSYELSTFTDLLKESISNGVTDQIPSALVPCVNLIGNELFGYDPDADIHEIQLRINEIDSKLDELKEEVSAGFDKVLNEIDKNNKMKNAIDALSKAEFIAETIISSNKAELANDIYTDSKKLTPKQQKEIVEINADIVNNQQVTELYTNLKLAKEYMATGFIDTDYKNVFEVYYNYMKKDSMFCGEAANKAEPFWEVMKESYSKSCVVLFYALEHQRDIYLLSESTPTDEISQEAIDAAAVSKTFGTLSVINNRIANVDKDATQLIDKYDQFIEKVRAEATTFINKDTVCIELKSDVKGVDISNCKTYGDYVKYNNFENDGISEKLYNKILKQVSRYYYNYDRYAMDLVDISYNDFVRNTGKCYRHNMVTEFSNKSQLVNFAEHSDNIFSHVMLNMKFDKYNTANKLENENMEAIIKHIRENYENDSIEEYLENVGFDMAGVNSLGKVLLPTDVLSLSGYTPGLDTQKNVYEVDTYNKKNNSLNKLIDTKNPSGVLMFLEKENDSLGINIHSVSMDGRIDMGVYTITGRQILGYTSNNKPIYHDYEKVYEVKGTKDISFRLPENIELNTLEITLGYEGLCASSNHENVCSYSFEDLKSYDTEITLTMEGYTKIWLGYGVDASISCDGVVVAKGEG